MASTSGAWGFVLRSMVLMVAGAAVCKLIAQWVEDKGCAAGGRFCACSLGFTVPSDADTAFSSAPWMHPSRHLSPGPGLPAVFLMQSGRRNEPSYSTWCRCQ